jgi:hypothetical protein
VTEARGVEAREACQGKGKAESRRGFRLRFCCLLGKRPAKLVRGREGTMPREPLQGGPVFGTRLTSAFTDEQVLRHGDTDTRQIRYRPAQMAVLVS